MDTRFIMCVFSACGGAEDSDDDGEGTERVPRISGDVIFLTARPKQFRRKNFDMMVSLGFRTSTVLSCSHDNVSDPKKVTIPRVTGLRTVTPYPMPMLVSPTPSRHLYHSCARVHLFNSPNVFRAWVPRVSQIALLKLKAYLSLTRLYPEFRHGFIGDSGQGDVALAKTIAKGVSTRAKAGGMACRLQHSACTLYLCSARERRRKAPRPWH
jgi:hypothetical protein